jgi:hypothetical protein
VPGIRIRVLKEIYMKLKAALIALALAFSSAAPAAMVDPAEPPATPAGGKPETGITAGAVVGAAIVVAVVVAIANGDDDDATSTTTTTTTTTGP